MGFFGSDNNSDPVEELASQARGSTVTADILNKTERHRGASYTEGNPLIELLEDEEQPHYFFFNNMTGLRLDGDSVGRSMSNGYITVCLVTDQRVLLITDGTVGGAIHHNSIQTVETEYELTKNRLSNFAGDRASNAAGKLSNLAGDRMSKAAGKVSDIAGEKASNASGSLLTIFTGNHKYEMPVSPEAKDEEVKEAGTYIENQSDKTSSNKDGMVSIGNLKHPWKALNTDDVAIEGVASEPIGDFVTEERFYKINDILDSGEVVHYITSGKTIDVEGSGAGSSAFGNDRSRKNSFTGRVRAVVTDKRVAVKIPQMTGDDERSIPYDSITSVDLDTGLVNKRITLQTPGSTYHIEAQEPGKEEVREAVSFIRKMRKEANQPEVVATDDSSEPDPLEQLEKLRELHEKGAVSDDEFEEKKSDLLDKI